MSEFDAGPEWVIHRTDIDPGRIMSPEEVEAYTAASELVRRWGERLT